MNEINNTDYAALRDRISACVFAGALGDALGYTVEFSSVDAIKRNCGEGGICEPRLTGDRAVFSDDTQMTLFTMEGMTECFRRKLSEGADLPVEYCIYLSYLKWAQTQKCRLNFEIPLGWRSALAEIPGMNQLRAPGNTCLGALCSGSMGTVGSPINNSKGCGGVMRAAPLGFAGNFGNALENGAKAAAVTHGHPLGWIPAGMLADTVYKILYTERKPLKAVIEQSLADTAEKFSVCDDIGYFSELINRAISLSQTDMNDLACIESLGGGWVGEEALAIAVYCCLKYPCNLKKALIAAVNHSGDSDSTGAVAGNILGAYLGTEAIPADWLEKLEMTDVIRAQIDGIMSLIAANAEKQPNGN